MNESINKIRVHWYDSQTELLDFAKYLHDKNEFDDADAVIYFFEKPWKWNEEWKEYKINQKKINSEFNIISNLNYCDLDPNVMMDSNGSDY